MGLLYRIVYAAHANGTHHKLALDALARVQSANSERWQNLFLKYAKPYLEGSKAPDNTFKDFKNHVLHVRDDYWGGAPEKAQEWYGKLLEALRGQAWSDAAYAAGVLSCRQSGSRRSSRTPRTARSCSICTTSCRRRGASRLLCPRMTARSATSTRRRSPLRAP
jgi:hypothetical protein